MRFYRANTAMPMMRWNTFSFCLHTAMVTRLARKSAMSMILVIFAVKYAKRLTADAVMTR